MQVVDYTQIINYCSKIQDKLSQVKNSLAEQFKDSQQAEASNQQSKGFDLNQCKQVVKSNSEKL